MTSYPPGPRSLSFWTTLKRFRIDPISFLSSLAREYGDVAHVKLGTMHLVALNDPKDIEQVLIHQAASFVKSPTLRRARRLLGNGLLTSEEPLHQCQRSRMIPSFNGERMRVYDDVVIEYVHRHMETWHDGMTFDFADEMKRLTLSIIGKVLFGNDFEMEAAAIERDFATSLDRLRPFRAPLLTNPRFLEWIPGTKGWQFRSARTRLNSVVRRLIAVRRADCTSERDMLSMLLNGRDEESATDAGMLDEQARDEVITLMLAGHETVAHALTWTWYLLAQHPEVEDAFHREVDSIVDDAKLSVEAIEKLPYTRMILTEAMRLYPPVWVIARQAQQPCILGGYSLPAGTVVSMSQFLVHRDPRWYRNPTTFLPDRWALDKKESDRPRFAYFPFGAGPRHCLGERFAWMEAILVLASIGRKWRSTLVPGANGEVDAGFTLRPKHGLRVTLKHRT